MDFEAFILDGLENIGQFDFNSAIKLLIFAIGVVWIFTTYWVWKDTETRIHSVIVRMFVTLLVLPLNFIALIAYLLSRPKDTFESEYWSDLEKRYLQYETKDMHDCENCGYDLQPGFLYCPVCSYPVKVKCHSCGELIDRYWNYCPFCRAQQREFVPEKKVELDKHQTAGIINKSIPYKKMFESKDLEESSNDIPKAENEPEVEEEILIDEDLDVGIDVIDGAEDLLQDDEVDIPLIENESVSNEAEVSISDENVTEDESIFQPEDVVTNEPQPQFGLDEVSMKPEVQKMKPKQQFVGIANPVRSNVSTDLDRKDASLPTELGRYVISNVSAFGKKINDFFMNIFKKREVVKTNDELEENIENDESSMDVLSKKVDEREKEIVDEVKESIGFDDSDDTEDEVVENDKTESDNIDEEVTGTISIKDKTEAEDIEVSDEDDDQESLDESLTSVDENSAEEVESIEKSGSAESKSKQEKTEKPSKDQKEYQNTGSKRHKKKRKHKKNKKNKKNR